MSDTKKTAEREHLEVLERIRTGYQTEKDYRMLPLWCDILGCAVAPVDFMGEPLMCQVILGRIIPPMKKSEEAC